jgi:hypothetical protein
MCHLSMRDFTQALHDAHISRVLNPGWVKGFFREAQALLGLAR